MHFQADETDAMKDEAPMSLNVFEPRAVDPGSKRWRNQGSKERTSEGGGSWGLKQVLLKQPRIRARSNRAEGHMN